MIWPHMPTVDADRPKPVLLGLLYAIGGEAYRTKLVQLTYLLDESCYRLRGHTMTGFDYERDRSGPNATGDMIVRTLDEMASSRSVIIRRASTPRVRSAYVYRIGPDFNPDLLPLSGDDWAEIFGTVHRYGRMNRAQLARESRSTAPMRNARPGQPLRLLQDPPLSAEEVDADPFWRETMSAMTGAQERVSIEELRDDIAAWAAARS